MLQTGVSEPGAETGKFRSVGTGKNYRLTVYSGDVKSTGVQFILAKIRLTEYSIRDSPCMHAIMQRGNRFACMRV